MLVKFVSADLGLVPPPHCQCMRALPCLQVKKTFLLVLCPGPTAFRSSSVLIRGRARQVQQTISFAVSAEDLKRNQTNRFLE